MQATTSCKWLGTVILGLAIAGQWQPAAAAAPEAPKVSTFASADELVGQVEAYVEDLEKAVADENDFDEAKLSKVANTLLLMSVAVSVHDTDNKLKPAAGGLFAAAQNLAKAKGFPAAKAAVTAVKEAANGKGNGPAALKWEKCADLDATFKQAQSLLNGMKRNTKGSRLKSKAKETAGGAAVLAVIAQGVLIDTSHAKDDNEKQQWQQFCVEMRDAAAAANKAILSGNESATQEAIKTLNKSCEDCHAIFHKEGTKEENQ